MQNPFKYGVEVSGKDFVNREQELAELRRELLAGKSIILYSPRRLGKSSLLRELFRRMRDEAITVHLKLYGITTREAFARAVVQGTVTAAYTTVEKIRGALRMFKELRPSLVLTPGGEMRLEISRRPTLRELEEALNFPELLARKRGKRMIVAFDEFQEIASLDGIEIEKLMKARFEEHEHVSYVFAGSKRHLLREIFMDESRPLWRFARPLELKNIPKEDFARFIVRKFEETGGKISEGALRAVLEFTQGHPYFTQQLCHELWYLARKVDETHVARAIDVTLSHLRAEFEHIWDNLRSRIQRRLLLLMAREPASNYTSTSFIAEHGLRSAAHVHRAVESLERKGIIEEGRIADVFFAEWLRRLEG
jgi:hypothetical protein